MLYVQEKTDEERGNISSSKTTDMNTIKLYQLILWKDKLDIHLIYYSNAMNKCKRRQMASTSVCNLASHIAAVSYSNFIPALDKCEQPKHVTKGA